MTRGFSFDFKIIERGDKMPVYGFSDYNVASRLANNEGRGQLPQRIEDDSYVPKDGSRIIKNYTGVEIPPYGLVFCVEIEQQGSDEYMHVKTWSQIEGESDENAKAFPLFNGTDPVPVDSYGQCFPDATYNIAINNEDLDLGDTVGPDSTTNSFEVVSSSSLDLFTVVDAYDDPALLAMGSTGEDYCLVKSKEAAESPPLTVFIGSVTSLGDFPQGRGGAGATTTFYSTQPGVITATGKIVDGSSESTATIDAFYFGSFPIAVGADVFCIRFQEKDTTDSWLPAWWCVDAARYELNTTGPIGTP